MERLWAMQRLQRRDILRISLGMAMTTAVSLAGCSGARTNGTDRMGTKARIAIVGAGLAGLHCAYRLRQAGVVAHVYEASNRVGGRIYTARRAFANGQIAELGGEFIDANHTCMRRLAHEFDLRLDDHGIDEPPGLCGDRFYFDGCLIAEHELVEAFRPVALQMASTIATAEVDAAAFARVDAMNIVEWLDGLPEASDLVKRILTIAYTNEYGLEADEQSVFNLLSLIDFETPDAFHIFGNSDERYQIQAGNDTLITRLAAAVAGQIETDARLVAVTSLADGRYRLTFARSATTFERDVDHVVFALPFTLLREVALRVALPEDKTRVIHALGYGTNAKLLGQFTSRVWRVQHQSTGSIMTDNGLQSLYDASRRQEGNTGVLMNFLGGCAGMQSGRGTAEAQMRAALPRIDAIFPGTAAAYIAASAMRMHWPTAPFALGSYAVYRPGQTSFQGMEGARVGNLHFCGEHCSVEFHGFMEGACETSARVAAALLQELKRPSTSLARLLGARQFPSSSFGPHARRRLQQ